MFREQLLGLAARTISQAYETKERVKNNLNRESVQNYVQTIKDVAVGVVEHQWQKIRNFERVIRDAKAHKNGEQHKKTRKSSIRPAKEIGSSKADIVLKALKDSGARLVDKHESINGKMSLAYLVWALGHAERAGIAEGISVHDVCALLYRACKIELYPINVSRVVYGNALLVHQVGQQGRTKNYLLTKEGMTLFQEKYLKA